MIAELHREHGVEMELGHGVSGFEERNGKLTGVTLGNGRTVKVDAADVAVGARPAVDWLWSSALPLTATTTRWPGPGC